MEESTGIASRAVAEYATQACEGLSQCLARLVGEHGVNTLFKRSALRAKRHSPWLASSNPWGGAPRDAPWRWLHASMEQQDPATATEGFILVLSAVVELLENLLGKGVVKQLLEQAWPAVFPQVRRTREPPS
jgi:hypothetical protein